VFRARIVVLFACLSALAAAPSRAQTLTQSLFERYVDALREQAGIPGLSVAVVQNGVTWARGLGRQDVEANVPATPDTPYSVGNLSQIFGAALTLRNCLEFGSLETTDRVTRWVPTYPEPDATIDQLLTHATAGGAFRYDPARFAGLTDVIVECVDRPYRHVLVDEILGRLAMTNSAPGADTAQPAAPGNEVFPPAEAARFAAIMRRTAPSYKVERGRAVRTESAPQPLSASAGVVTTVNDLVHFDVALTTGTILQPDTLAAAWTQASPLSGAALPTGRGWFVQNYNGEAVVWQYGVVPDGHSSLIVKLPGRGLTFIALANSDGLAAGYNLQNGDVTKSPFAALFLRFFVP
jgi:CubicO group peptidase (beta-lactamase class C family)